MRYNYSPCGGGKKEAVKPEQEGLLIAAPLLLSSLILPRPTVSSPLGASIDLQQLNLLSYSPTVPGIDLSTFREPVPAVFICPICKLVYDHPTLICSEEHIICQSCVESCPTSSQGDEHDRRCPSCQVEFFTPDARPSKALQRGIDLLAARCIDCGQQGTYSEIKKHRMGDGSTLKTACGYKSAGCSFASACPSAHDEHLNEECAFAQVACPRGGPDCGGAERSEQGIYSRCDRREHENVCTMWSCSVDGCPTTGSRAALKKHTPYCLNLHRTIENLKQQVAEESKEIRHPKASAQLEFKSTKALPAPAAVREDHKVPKGSLESAEAGQLGSSNPTTRNLLQLGPNLVLGAQAPPVGGSKQLGSSKRSDQPLKPASNAGSGLSKVNSSSFANDEAAARQQSWTDVDRDTYDRARHRDSRERPASYSDRDDSSRRSATAADPPGNRSPPRKRRKS